MVEINGMFILDYPDLVTTKKITEEGQKRIREATEIMRKFMKEHDIKIVTPNGTLNS